MNDILVFLVKNAIEIVFSLLGILVTAIIIPWIKNNAIPWLKEKQLYSTVDKFVKAAEKFAENHDIDKKTYVLNLLEAKGIKATPVVEALIESAVKELDLIKENAKEQVTEDNTTEME